MFENKCKLMAKNIAHACKFDKLSFTLGIESKEKIKKSFILGFCLLADFMMPKNKL